MGVGSATSEHSDVPDVRRVGPLVVNVKSREAWANSALVSLTPTEFDLLLLLMEHPGWVVTPERLSAAVWPDGRTSHGALSVHICHLRQKLASATDGRQLIETIRGAGYRLWDGRRTAEQAAVASRIEPGASGTRPPFIEPAETVALQIRGAHLARQSRDVEVALGHLDIASTALLSVAEADRDRDWWALWLAVGIERADVLQWAGQPAALVQASGELLEALNHHGTPAQAVHLRRSMAIALLLLDRWIPCDEAVTHAQVQYEQSRELAAAHRCMAEAFFGAVLRMDRQLPQAVHHLRQAREEAAALGETEAQLLALGNLGIGAIMDGDADLAGEYGHAILSVPNSGAFPDNIAGAHALVAWSEWRNGRTAAAARSAAQAREYWATTPHFPYQWIGLVPAAAVSLQNRNLDEALAHIRSMLSESQQRLPAHIEARAVGCVSDESPGGRTGRFAAVEALLAECAVSGCV